MKKPINWKQEMKVGPQLFFQVVFAIALILACVYTFNPEVRHLFHFVEATP